MRPRSLPYIAFWKKCLSYLVDIDIEQTESVFQNDLFLVLRRGKLMLCTESAIYSYEDRYYNFSGLFTGALNMDEIKGREVLVLGLGLASVPLELDRIYPGEWDITAVEIDEEVCRLANDYILPRIRSGVEIVIADALSFMQMNHRQFDLVCVDIFIDDGVPEAFKQANFLERCKDALSDNGLIIYNTPAFDDVDKQDSMQFFYDFKQIFPEAKALEVHKNYMLINAHRALKN